MKNLVIFDFSGTLSMGAVLFGEDENLIKELKHSGLWQIGVNSLDMFWDDVIAPTWRQGATTAIGYKKLLTARLNQIYHGLQMDIVRCAAAFADRYFSSSRIHPAWIPLLHDLVNQPGILMIIATDHYAEATCQILKQLEESGVPGVPTSQADQKFEGDRIIVANSADLGYLKATPEFWQAVREALALDGLSKILVIDDFGSNESLQDSYAEAEKITTREQSTIQVLADVFNCPVKTFPFLLKNNNSAEPEALMSEYQEIVKKAEAFTKEAIV